MSRYTYNQVLEESTKYFNGDEFAAKVFVDKYALQNSNGEYLELTPDDMHLRLAKEFARIEQKYPNPLSQEEIFNLLDHFKYIVAQGSPMFGIGNDFFIQSLGNCFVVDSCYDSYGGILKTDQELAQLMKRRAGVGTDLSNIRPKGVATANAAKTTDGIGVFMERFSNTCREVAQSGRRGALLLSISIEHPEIETFIKIKQNSSKITGANVSVRITDEFMQAVKEDKEFTLKWPVNSSNPKITKIIKAKELWNELVHCAHASAEPGILFWDNIINNSPADIYAVKNPNFKTQSTNPCFSGDTLIAVADGRNAVSIKQLAEENKDVPVYSVNKNTGLVEIKMGRNPRITGYSKQLVRVWLDSGKYLDTTLDHKFLLLNGETVEAKDLKNGDSLPRFTKSLEPVKTGSKDYYRIYCNTKKTSEDKIFEHRLIAQFYNTQQWDEMYNTCKQNGFANTGGIVVHHKDYNQLNNSPDNLQIMTFKDHSKLHGEIDQAGEKNGRWYDISNEQLKQYAIDLTKQLGRRFSRKEWINFAEKNKLPKEFSSYRKTELGNVVSLAKWAAIECGVEYIDEDPRVVKTLQSMLQQGYNAKIQNGTVYVIKSCELCHNDFEIEHDQREVALCSINCKNIYLNSDTEIKNNRDFGSYLFLTSKMEKIKQEQARIYSQLKFYLQRNPLMKEWEQTCAAEKIPHRVGKSLKYSFKNFKEVAEAGNNYNHKVVKIEKLDELHTVYNITVDDNHTVAVITEIKQKRNNNWYSGVFVPQCGELPLGLDSCRLLVVNLLSCVKNPFEQNAEFDYVLFDNITQKAQRLMDDLIDLEIEKIEKIINKIKSDPEPESIKQVELNMWNVFLDSCKAGRRTGLGITALGDCIASLNVKYGSKESIEITEKIYRQLAISAYKSSCQMAKERGAFPLFDRDLEKNHEFINKIINQDKELYELYMNFGRRNIALTTTAPTGSVSILTQTTSGIEPAYLLSYVRRKKINPSDKNAKVDFVDPMGDKWQEFVIYHHGIKKWMDITGESEIKKSPYWGATSNEIDWVASVDIQAAAQRWICHSISKTCNLPSTATEELVSQVYMRAWEAKCKGFTVYRDGCRTGVLVSEESAKKNKSSTDRPDSIEHSLAPKRPIELSCDIKKAKVNGEAWTIFVGLLNNKPYEVFGGLSKYVDIPNKHKVGKITKNGKNSDGLTTYNLVIGDSPDDRMVIKDIANIFENKTYEAFTRMISLNLRHGTPIQFVVEQLTKDKYAEMTSFSKVVARVLKSYIKDGSKSTSEKKCANCGAEGTLIYQEGCLSCTQCKWSKC